MSHRVAISDLSVGQRFRSIGATFTVVTMELDGVKAKDVNNRMEFFPNWKMVSVSNTQQKPRKSY